MKRTPRGFCRYAEFTDERDQPIRVQQSSLATQPCVWVWIGNDEYGKRDPVSGHLLHPAMHLTRGQARRLITALTKFLDDTEGPKRP